MSEQDNIAPATTPEQNDAGLLQGVQEQAPVDTSTPKEPEQAQADARPEWLPEKFKTAEDLAKSYSELEKKMTNHVPKDYDFSITKEVGLADMPEDLATEVTDVFKKANFSQAQVKTAMALYADQMAKVQADWANQPRTDLAKEETALKTAWGNDYTNRLEAVKKFAGTLPERVINTPLVDSAEGIQYLEQLMEGNRMPNPIQNTATTPRQDPVAIREQIREMRGDAKFKLPPGDMVGDAHRQRLYQLYEQLDRLTPKQ
jgi:hypothetical protein